jgi:hypothetical protein
VRERPELSGQNWVLEDIVTRSQLPSHRRGQDEEEGRTCHSRTGFSPRDVLGPYYVSQFLPGIFERIPESGPRRKQRGCDCGGMEWGSPCRRCMTMEGVKPRERTRVKVEERRGETLRQEGVIYQASSNRMTHGSHCIANLSLQTFSFAICPNQAISSLRPSTPSCLAISEPVTAINSHLSPW